MVFYTKYKSPLGYSNGDNQIDSYGTAVSARVTN